MSHANSPHKSFARYASVLRENLIACDASLRKGEEDWQATLGRLNAAFNQTKNLNNIIENSYEHVVYVPKKCTANIQDISSFLSCRCAPDSIASAPESLGRIMNEGGDGEKNNNSAGRGVIDRVHDNEDIEEDEKDQSAPILLQRYEHKVYELASEFEEEIVRF